LARCGVESAPRGNTLSMFGLRGLRAGLFFEDPGVETFNGVIDSLAFSLPVFRFEMNSEACRGFDECSNGFPVCHG
jgi:hypothetical protein